MLIPAWQYSHLSMVDQLDFGLRHLELDIWFNKTTASWEIWHECVDRLTCVGSKNLVTVLTQLKRWSDENPDHFPINYNVDVKGMFVCL